MIGGGLRQPDVHDLFGNLFERDDGSENVEDPNEDIVSAQETVVANNPNNVEDLLFLANLLSEHATVGRCHSVLRAGTRTGAGRCWGTGRLCPGAGWRWAPRRCRVPVPAGPGNRSQQSACPLLPRRDVSWRNSSPPRPTKRSSTLAGGGDRSHHADRGAGADPARHHRRGHATTSTSTARLQPPVRS